MIPRADYPEGLTGYRSWRRALSDFHVQEASSILLDAGYDDATISRVRNFLTKTNLKRDTEMQLFMVSRRSGGAGHRNGLRDRSPACIRHVLLGVEGKVSESNARGMILAELHRSEYIKN